MPLLVFNIQAIGLPVGCAGCISRTAPVGCAECISVPISVYRHADFQDHVEFLRILFSLVHGWRYVHPLHRVVAFLFGFQGLEAGSIYPILPTYIKYDDATCKNAKIG
jgi:hypothetical protein